MEIEQCIYISLSLLVRREKRNNICKRTLLWVVKRDRPCLINFLPQRNQDGYEKIAQNSALKRLNMHLIIHWIVAYFPLQVGIQHPPPLLGFFSVQITLFVRFLLSFFSNVSSDLLVLSTSRKVKPQTKKICLLVLKHACE